MASGAASADLEETFDVRMAAAAPDAGATAGPDLLDGVGARRDRGLDRAVADPLAGAHVHGRDVR